MSKTLQDYRNIVKILKLEYLKLKVENQHTCEKIGEINPHAKSSFSDRILSLKNLKAQNSQIAINTLVFLEFAEKCELLGITPEMVFRITDKNRTKKITLDALKNTLKKLTLRLDDVGITRICAFLNINKDNTLKYDDYMAVINAYQIQTEKYPTEGKSYTQKALNKFSDQFKGEGIDQVFSEISRNSKAFTYEQFASYAKSNLKQMTQTQLTAVFLALNTDDSNQVKKNNFTNEIARIQMDSSLIKGKGTQNTKKDEDQVDERQSKRQSTIKQSKINDPVEQKKVPKKPEENRKQKEKKREYDSDKEFGEDDQQGDRGGAKQKKKTELSEQSQALSSIGLSVQLLLEKVLDTANAGKLMKQISFSFLLECAVNISKKVKKKTVLLDVFKYIDTQQKGSLSNLNLVKFWVEERQKSSSIDILYKILYRQLKMNGKDDARKFFVTKKIKMKEPFDAQFKRSFPELSLDAPTLSKIKSLLKAITGEELAQSIKQCEQVVEDPPETVQKPKDQFLSSFSKLLKPLLPKNPDEFRHLKLSKTSSKKAYWNTIFTNEWVCWNYCLQTIKTLKSSWKDPEFGGSEQNPDGHDSLYPQASDENKYGAGWTNYAAVLKKLKTKNQRTLFDEQIVPSDPVQGMLDDCWFVACLSILAQYPILLRGNHLEKVTADDCMQGISPDLFNIFNKYGMYVFKFTKGGTTAYVVVDDSVPSLQSTTQLIFAHSTNQKANVQWAALAQKAFAKLHTNYFNLEAGDISEGLKDLTQYKGIRQILVKTKKDEKQNKKIIWKKLLNYKNNKSPMGCSITLAKDEDSNQFLQKGLVVGHAYSISDVFTIKSTEGEQFKLVRIRNPYGSDEFRLDWSEHDQLQNKHLQLYEKEIREYYQKQQKKVKNSREKAVEKYTKKEDGVFLMSFDDWYNYYTNLFVAIDCSEWNGVYGTDSWSKEISGFTSASAEKSLRQKVSEKNHMYLIELQQQAEVMLRLEQTDMRLYRGQLYPFKTATLSVKWMGFKVPSGADVLDFDKDADILKNSKLQMKRDVSCLFKFPKGSYVVMPIINELKPERLSANDFLNFRVQFLYKCDNQNIKVRNFNKKSKMKFQQCPKKQVENKKEIELLIKKVNQYKSS